MPDAARAFTLGDLRREIARASKLPDHYEVTVRAHWEGTVPNGICFRLVSLSIGEDHDTCAQFLALDCDQEF